MPRILIMTGDGCTPDLDYAVFRMREERFQVTVAAPKKQRIYEVLHQQEEGWDNYIERPWYLVDADASFDELDPSTFDALLLPGGRAPWHLRNLESCLRLVRHFVEREKPIGAICRGPLILLEAGVKRRHLTGSFLIKPRVAIGGCTYVDGGAEPVRDGNIVTVTGRPYYHVWTRAFLSMLKERGLAPRDDRKLGKLRVLILIGEATASGILDYAQFRMLEEGCDVTVAAPAKKPVRTVVIRFAGNGDTFEQLPGWIVQPDASFDEVNPADFDALMVPGGPGPEYLRVDSRCIDIVRHFVEHDKPMTAICHGPHLLVEGLVAAGVKRKRMTGTHAIKADIRAAGYEYVDSPGRPVIDGNLVTAWMRPDYDVWIRGFVSLLKERGIAAARAA